MRHSDRLLTTQDEEDDEEIFSLGEKLLLVLLWPGYKSVELLLGRIAPAGGGWGAGIFTIFLGFCLFLLVEILFWGLVIAVIGNAIGFMLTGHF